jgi:ribonuclease HI
MNSSSTYHIGYTDGANHLDQESHLEAWALYTPDHVLLHSSGICLGPATNNQVEYTTVIGLLSEASHLGIHHLSVLLYSHLIVHQLNNMYNVCDPCLYRKYLQVKLLLQNFESITFTHISRNHNQMEDHIANQVLDWNLSH